MTEVARLMTPIGENDGTALTRFNALRHGILSRYTVLPWEDEGEDAALITSLAAEHAPEGPTEEHLVEEIAGILWRKRRLRMAEGAAHRRGLDKALDNYSNTARAALTHITDSARSEEAGDAVRTSVSDDADDLADLDADEAMTRKAIGILGTLRNDAYEAALAELRDDTRGWWADMIARDPTTSRGRGTPNSRHRGPVPVPRKRGVAVVRQAAKELAHRPLIRVQALGEALDPNRLENSGRYEVHLIEARTHARHADQAAGSAPGPATS